MKTEVGGWIHNCRILEHNRLLVLCGCRLNSYKYIMLVGLSEGFFFFCHTFSFILFMQNGCSARSKLCLDVIVSISVCSLK